MKPADHIRDLAEAMGYWSLATDDARRNMRLVIRIDYPSYSRQAIADALKRRAKPGRPKHPRCPHCGRPMPTTRQQGATP